MSTIWWIIGAIGLWKMFEKAGEPGWIGIIPLYRDYKLCEKVMGNPWYWLRELVLVIPVIGWVGYIYFKYQIGKATARAYGKPDSWAWGYALLDVIFYCITGFDNSDYYGPYGSGDRRTGEARQARTVDFDVVKPTVEPYRSEPDVSMNQADDMGAGTVRDVEFETTDNGSDVEFEFEQDGIGE